MRYKLYDIIYIIYYMAHEPETGQYDRPSTRTIVTFFVKATYVYDWCLHKVKDRWMDQQDWNNPSEEGHFWNVIDCCALKALTGWSVGEIADSK